MPRRRSGPVNVKAGIYDQWKNHKRLWNGCNRCGLANVRTNVVLVRGSIPCDVGFLGEAPGESEDLLKEPFVGPAGKKLDDILEAAIAKSQTFLRLAIFNVVGCFPRTDEGFRQPAKDEIEACRPRLEDFLSFSKPRLIVTLGRIAKGHLPKTDVEVVSLVHPSFIVRTERDSPAKARLDQKRCIMTLARWFTKIDKEING